jgi:predicted Rossmann fold nucleotide-binding protein DprA/Smf involved in DNA uptake
VVVEDAQYPSSLITALLAMEFGHAVYGPSASVSQPTPVAPNQMIQYGGKACHDPEGCASQFTESSFR